MAAVGRLTASIAHEINNPLQSVRNCLHLVDSGKLSVERTQEYMDLATEELDRLINTAKRMIEYYRPVALDRSDTDINELIRRVLQLIGAQLRAQSVEVHTNLADDLHPILAVGNQIQQVIFNLLLNALEAMPENGEIFIATKHDHDHVIILIEDTGPGIAQSEKDNIFEPFVSTKEEGLGLGLTVSYGIVTAHGGTLELLPSLDRGARFKISFPIGR